MFDFAVWVGLGSALGLWRIARNAARQSETWVDAGLFVLVMALVGSRLSYIYTNRAYFSNHIAEAPMLWLGGLTWPGAFLGLLLACACLALIFRSSRSGRISIGWICDRIYPLLPPVAIAAWLGSWQAGAGYGPTVPPGSWWGVATVDETGAVMQRWPLQFMAALSLLIFFWVLESRVKQSHPPGRLSGAALGFLLLHLLLFSLFCADPSPYWNGLRLDTWAAIIYLILLCSFILFNYLVIRLGRLIRSKLIFSRS